MSKMKRDTARLEYKLTYVLSCLMKLEKLLCLKNLGSRSLENSRGFHTIKLLLPGVQDTTGSVEGSLTIS